MGALTELTHAISIRVIELQVFGNRCKLIHQLIVILFLAERRRHLRFQGAEGSPTAVESIMIDGRGLIWASPHLCYCRQLTNLGRCFVSKVIFRIQHGHLLFGLDR